MGVYYSASFAWGIDLGSVDSDKLDEILRGYDGLLYSSYGDGYSDTKSVIVLDRSCQSADEFDIFPLTYQQLIPPSRDEIDLLKDAYVEFLGLDKDERPNDDLIQPYLSLYVY